MWLVVSQDPWNQQPWQLAQRNDMWRVLLLLLVGAVLLLLVSAASHLHLLHQVLRLPRLMPKAMRDSCVLAVLLQQLVPESTSGRTRTRPTSPQRQAPRRKAKMSTLSGSSQRVMPRAKLHWLQQRRRRQRLGVAEAEAEAEVEAVLLELTEPLSAAMHARCP